MPRILVNGARLYYEDSGAGPETIVFAHGLLLNGRMFDAQVAALRRRYRCITFDYCGHGRSARSPHGHNLNVLAGDAMALIQALGAAPCHLLGYSMGGFLALRVALRRPELLRSLLLVSTSADAEPLWNQLRIYALSWAANLVGLRPLVGLIGAGYFGRRFRTDPGRTAEKRQCEEWMAATDLGGLHDAVRAISERRSVAQYLERIRLPTLVVVGAEDGATVPEKARRLHRGIPGSKLVVFPEVAHVPTVEAPAAVNAALLEFLSQLS